MQGNMGLASAHPLPTSHIRRRQDLAAAVEPSVGIALHLTVSAANHACAPNCALQTALPGLPGWAVLQAVRDVSRGATVSRDFRRVGLAVNWSLVSAWRLWMVAPLM
eukprot:7401900-Alexandrium_andersonii.AAC.3